MAVTSISMHHTKIGTNHKETSSGMNHFVDKPCIIVLGIVMYPFERLIQGQLFAWDGYYQSLDFVF